MLANWLGCQANTFGFLGSFTNQFVCDNRETESISTLRDACPDQSAGFRRTL